MKRFFLFCLFLFSITYHALAQVTTKAGDLFNISVVSGSLTVTSTPNFYYQYAGVKIITPGYTLSGVGSECTMQNNGYCLFPVSNTQPAVLSFAGPAPGEIEVSLCLNVNGSKPSSCQRYSGSFAKIRYAYISNNNTGNADSIVRCEVSDTDGTLSACTPVGSNGLADITSLAINPSGLTLYLGDGSQGAIDQCPLTGEGGVVASCSLAPNTFSLFTTGSAINPAGDTYYFVDGLDARISSCTIDSSEQLINCGFVVGGDFNDPGRTAGGMAISPDGEYAYFTLVDNITSEFGVKVCPIVSNGVFGTCIDAASPGTFDFQVFGIGIDPSGTYAYVTDSPNIYTCTIDRSNGLFSSCIANTQIFFNALPSVTVNSTGTIAYFPVIGGLDTISVCNINPITGVLDSCQNSGSGFNIPVTLVLSP